MQNHPKNLPDELQSIKELLEIVKDKVDRMESFQNVTMQQARDIKDQQSVMNKKLDTIEKRAGGIEEQLSDPDTGLEAINRRLDANTGAVMELEKTVKGYADMYKVNDSNIRKMQKRLETVEENAGIEIPSELHLVDF